MKEVKIEILIDKFLRGELSDNELNDLEIRLKSPENKESLKDFMEVDFLLKSEVEADFDRTKSYDKVTKKLNFNKIRRLSIQRALKYAAVFVGLIGVTYYFSDFNRIDNGNVLNDAYKNSITLQLENGNIEVISETGEKKVIDKNGKIVGAQYGDKLLYQIDEDLDKLVYNELNVPNGKTFELELSDGTKIHLNAGTSLKYPVNFIKGEERKVFLKGEAYFEVAKDAKHPFIVASDKMDVRVLGTKFNVDSYNNGGHNTVLVEGSVALYEEGNVYNEKTATLLTPGHIAKWKKDGEMLVEMVDTDEYTAWTTGKLIFKRRDFVEITKILERHFDIVIENNYGFLDSQRFLASFETESIEQILEYFKKTTNFNYQYTNNKVIINKP